MRFHNQGLMVVIRQEKVIEIAADLPIVAQISKSLWLLSLFASYVVL